MKSFSQSDIEQIQSYGLTISDIEHQLSKFESGFAFANIIRPATENDGILQIFAPEYEKYYTAHQDKYKITKFVPASGAATRMFQDLFKFLDTNIMNDTTQHVLQNITKFAFYDDLSKTLPDNASDKTIIEHIITSSGLNYGNTPKGLITFHKYNNETRTAIAEHLVEGAQYASSNGTVDIHFTVSPEHINAFQEHLGQIKPEYEKRFGITYQISISTQKPETDTIAVTPDNTPFRTTENRLLFRPSGHGALIKNLNEIDSEIIFIKNIDNVCCDDMRHDTIIYKRALAGLAIRTQQQIFAYQDALTHGNADISQVRQFIEQNLGIRKFNDSDISNILNRPLRVCGMVRNTGAPGGGPFWTRGPNGTETLQIVESSQISPQQQDILKSGAYFNSVDIICMPYDRHGNKYDLNQFIDFSTGFISDKTQNSRPLRAMERPGLWNGAMSDWNTVFIETPGTTFTPAKTVTDLIKPGHINK